MNRYYLILMLLLPSITSVYSQGEKARVVILADMGNEPDEEQQMTHMLMCSNEFELEGLIAVSGKFLHSEHRFPERRRVYPELFLNIIDAYEKVYKNLQLHAEGWHSPQYLRSIVSSGTAGYGVNAIGKGKGTSGSELLVQSFLKDDHRPIYIVVNAGSNTLAQALVDFKSRYSKKQLQAVLEKIRVFENGAQDDAGAWINANFPGIQWMRSNYQTYAYGGPAWGWGRDNNPNKGPHTWQPYEYSATGQHQWALEHIKNHGPMGKVYPLRQNGNGRLVFIEGGGTIPWLGLLHQGLSDVDRPHWGGWSGRFSESKIKNVFSRHESIRSEETDYGDFMVHTEVKDTWADVQADSLYQNIFAPIWRWRQAYFNDFQCRMDWCIKPYEEANHHPVAAINGDKEEKIHTMEVQAGESISFDASASTDPDGDELEFKWWIYYEAGTYDGEMPKIKNDTSARPSITIPEDASGKTIHLILELKDLNDIVELRDYRRIVIKVSE